MKWYKFFVVVLVLAFLIQMVLLFCTSRNFSENELIFDPPYITWLKFGQNELYYEEDEFFDNEKILIDFFATKEDYSIKKNAVGLPEKRRMKYSCGNFSLNITQLKDSLFFVKEEKKDSRLKEKIFYLKDKGMLYPKYMKILSKEESNLVKSREYYYYNEIKKDSSLVMGVWFFNDSLENIQKIRILRSKMLIDLDNYLSIIKKGDELDNFGYDEFFVEISKLTPQVTNILIRNENNEIFKVFTKEKKDNSEVVTSYDKNGKRLAELHVNNKKNLSLLRFKDGTKQCNREVAVDENGDTLKVKHECDSYFDNDFVESIEYQKGLVTNDSVVYRQKFLWGVEYNKEVIVKKRTYNYDGEMQAYTYDEKLYNKIFPLIFVPYEEKPAFEQKKEFLFENDKFSPKSITVKKAINDKRNEGTKIENYSIFYQNAGDSLFSCSFIY